MAGFTAINTRAISAPTPIVDDAFEEKEIESAQQKTTKRRQPARKKTASPDADSQVATSKPAPKRIGGKGRKRTNEPGDEPSSKRRRSGSVDLNLLITKPGVNASTAKDPKQINRSDVVGISSTDADLISLASKTKLNGFRYSTESAVRANTLESKSATSHPVYMPHTSMDSVSKEHEGIRGDWHGTANRSGATRDVVAAFTKTVHTDMRFSSSLKRSLKRPCKSYRAHKQAAQSFTRALSDILPRITRHVLLRRSRTSRLCRCPLGPPIPCLMHHQHNHRLQ